MLKKKIMKKAKLFIGALSFDTNDETLRQWAAKYGRVKLATVMNDRVTGKSRGFGFVLYETAADADRLLARGQWELDGREIKVTKAAPKAPKGYAPPPLIPIGAGGGGADSYYHYHHQQQQQQPYGRGGGMSQQYSSYDATASRMTPYGGYDSNLQTASYTNKYAAGGRDRDYYRNDYRYQQQQQQYQQQQALYHQQLQQSYGSVRKKIVLFAFFEIGNNSNPLI